MIKFQYKIYCGFRAENRFLLEQLIRAENRLVFCVVLLQVRVRALYKRAFMRAF